MVVKSKIDKAPEIAKGFGISVEELLRRIGLPDCVVMAAYQRALRLSTMPGAPPTAARATSPSRTRASPRRSAPTSAARGQYFRRKVLQSDQTGSQFAGHPVFPMQLPTCLASILRGVP